MSTPFFKKLFRPIEKRIRRFQNRRRYFRKHEAANRKPHVFLFGAPAHSNLGDQAQCYCIQRWLKRYLPEYEVETNTLSTANKAYFADLKKVFRKGDILLCHSGYHITDLYDEKRAYLTAAKLFPEEPLRILPQTVHFENPDNLKAVADTFNSHGQVTLLCRDEVSYENAQKAFNRCRLFLFPDIVTMLIGNFDYYTPAVKEGVLFCMRNDKEALYSKEDIAALREQLAPLYPTALTDTTISASYKDISADREPYIRAKVEEIARYRVVVTDRYHGTIFSLIANTPVIIVNSTDHKLSSGIKWFPESFRSHVFYAADLAEVPALIKRITEAPAPQPLPPYFAEKYYSRHLGEALNLPIHD